MVVEKNLRVTKNNAFQLSQAIKSCTNNICTGEKVFCRCYTFKGFGQSKKSRVYFGLYEFSSDFQKKDDQMNTVYEKYIYFLLADR